MEVIDSVADYVKLMKEIFDFDSLRDLLKGTEGREPFKVLINSLNGGKLNMHIFRRMYLKALTLEFYKLKYFYSNFILCCKF